jgi:competence protein ComEC
VLEVLGPPSDRVLLEGVNDRSTVLRVSHGSVSLLLTGDIEEAGEQALESGPVTVLKAPHHGSRTSSTPAFVNRVRPRFVVFCVGAQNRFRFPDDEVVERYRAVGARCLRTDVQGAIRFTSDGNTVKVETYHPLERTDSP